MRARIAAALLAILVLASPTMAQETRGSIEGIIKDASGAVLPGVNVEVKGITVGAAAIAVTDASGVYRFPALTPGVYEVIASLQGFNSAKSEQVDLQLGQVLKIDLALQLAGVAEAVQVTAESPLIDVKQSSAGQNIRADFIDRLPKGRDFTSLVTLAPGANQESRSGGISIDGASASENRYFIDGTDTTNLRTGVSGKQLLPEFIEQINVRSSGYAAEFGGSTGGVVNVITKSGTNSLRGDIGTYYNNDAMLGDERPTLRLVLTGQNQMEYVTLAKDDYKRWEPFFQVGGPIVRDRVWFYGGYTPQLEETGRTVTFRSNSQTGTYVSDEKTHYMTGNVTTQITNSLRARVASSYSRYIQDGRLPAKDGSSNVRTDFAGLGRIQPNLSTNGTVDYVVSNNLFLNAKANYLSYNTKDTGIPSDIWITFSQGSNGLFPGATNVQPNGYNSVLTNSASVKDLYQRIGVSADATFFANFAGRHSFKGGVQFERIRNDVFSAEQAPHISFNWDASRSTLDGRSIRGTYGYYSWRQFGTIGDVHVNNLGLFIQDDWSVNDKLTLNLGIRTEREDVPSYVEGLNGIKFSFGDKFAPRAGFAYDLRGDGKWKLYGSYGVFYDIMKLELPRGAFGGDKWIERYYTLDTLDYLSIGPNGNFPGTFLEAVNFRIPSNDPSCPECGAIDPDLDPMRQQELVGGLEHELMPYVSFGARYVHKQVDRAVEDVGIAVPGIGEVFYIANPGFGPAKFILGDECPTCPGLPVAKRDYDAVELTLKKRFSRNWQAEVSYTLSRLNGNYPGLASSDEVARLSPNVTRLFDSIIMAYDGDALPVYGRLNTDRPHYVKLNGYYEFRTATGVGATFRVASGIPVSRITNIESSTPVFYEGRSTDGRTPIFSQLDLQLTQDIRLPGSNRKFQVILNALNLFDQDETVDVFRNYTRDTVPLTSAQFLTGGHFDIDQFLATHPTIRKDPRFLQANTFQGARSIRIGAKFSF
jgi:Carboxypeptidase regulatory-like domain/TonB-dependent Receptor Plug Domain